MENNIKKIVDDLQLLYLKKKWQDAQTTIFQLNRKMQELALDYQVGNYAHNLDEMGFIIEELQNINDGKKKNMLKQKLFLLDLKNKKIESNDKIQKYLSLRNQYYYLLSQNHDYFKAIQIDFNNSLQQMDIPDIYVYQGMDVLPKHIIKKQQESKDAQIYPFYDLESKRDFRHFYNQVHYRYLESLINTNTFDLDKNNLGKVKIK